MRVVFQEYAWDMAWCDPCAADPLSNDQLRSLGVFWLDGTTERVLGRRNAPAIAPGSPQNVYVTRLHVRYDAESFPEDLVFQETGDRSNFQGRYVVRHAWKGESSCPEAERYRAELRQRQRREAETLAHLTGWSMDQILSGTNPTGPGAGESSKWWRKLWK
jgi:hypothetical protein